jgi:hypothetical protein
VIHYPRYSIFSAKMLDLEMFTLIPAVESLARTISNLSIWFLKLLFGSIFHILDKLRHDVLKDIKNQAILIPMGKRLYFYFHMWHGNTMVNSF